MFKRDEAARLRQEFWTVFGKYMSPVPSSEGLLINWINYRTGIKNVYFRMDVTNKSAQIYISLEHPNDVLRTRYFNQFQQLRLLLHTELREVWEWQSEAVSDGKMISLIGKTLPEVSVFNKAQWPDLIAFFKPRIVALDRFWENARYSFEDLKSDN